MIVAPELFTPKRALGALHIADSSIRGPLGMKTLDPSDSQYRPNYDNSNDGTDQAIAKGWNVSVHIGRIGAGIAKIGLTDQYHQGPEWGFPLGWFLMAYLKFDRIAGSGKDVCATSSFCSWHDCQGVTDASWALTCRIRARRTTTSARSS